MNHHLPPTLGQWGLKSKIEAECYYQTFVQVDSEVLLNRQLLKPAKRHASP